MCGQTAVWISEEGRASSSSHCSTAQSSCRKDFFAEQAASSLASLAAMEPRADADIDASRPERTIEAHVKQRPKIASLSSAPSIEP